MKVNPNIKKIQEEFVKMDSMITRLDLLPFYTVGRFIEIDFRELRKSLREKVNDYKDGIVRWAYENMMKTC